MLAGSNANAASLDMTAKTGATARGMCQRNEGRRPLSDYADEQPESAGRLGLDLGFRLSSWYPQSSLVILQNTFHQGTSMVMSMGPLQAAAGERSVRHTVHIFICKAIVMTTRYQSRYLHNATRHDLRMSLSKPEPQYLVALLLMGIL